MKKELPVSPHLQVYRLPISAWASVCHRISGIVLATVIGAGFPVYMLALAYAPAVIDQVRVWSGQWWFVLAQFSLSLIFIYHALSGVRHLLMDCGFWLEKDSSLLSARLLFAIAVALSLLLWTW